MAVAGLNAWYQPLDERQANAVGRIRGRGDGGDLLLYAPIDTAFGDTVEDARWMGAASRPDLTAHAVVDDGFVVGLGAENPKGYAACIIAAAEAVARARVPLAGDLIVGLGAGGMPTNPPAHPAPRRWNIGQGVGCAYMLEQGVRGDFAVIAKPGWTVSWEEVGLCWFRVTVKGALGYTGTRHILPYQNPLVAAADLIQALERWFPEYTSQNTSGLVAPQGSIGAIEGGWAHKPAFVPAACHLYVDLRVSPRTSVTEVRHQFARGLERIAQSTPGLALDWDMILAIPGTTTPPENWIIQSTTRAWEHLEGRPHVAEPNKSGATDANILRGWGVPTARIGMPRPSRPAPQQGQFSMGVVAIDSMRRLVQLLVYVIVDTCTRSRSELGLSSREAVRGQPADGRPGGG
jgi:acetylornithine deacetylase/succinyl-diaminopimelate desuccinylase-like protein